MQWRETDPAIAIKRKGLQKIPILNKEVSSLKAFKAFNISIITKTVKERVEAVDLPQVKYKQGSSLNS